MSVTPVSAPYGLPTTDTDTQQTLVMLPQHFVVVVVVVIVVSTRSIGVVCHGHGSERWLFQFSG